MHSVSLPGSTLRTGVMVGPVSGNEIELINVVNVVENTLQDREWLNNPVAALVVMLLLFPSLIFSGSIIWPQYCPRNVD